MRERGRNFVVSSGQIGHLLAPLNRKRINGSPLPSSLSFLFDYLSTRLQPGQDITFVVHWGAAYNFNLYLA